MLLGEEAGEIRTRFVSDYVDVDSQYFEDRIATLKRFSDGEFYSGYLWDVIPNYTRISGEQAASLARSLGSSYSLWDLHSADKIWLPDYWKFPRDAVLKGPAIEIFHARPILPADLYIIREDFAICLVLTHEEEPHGVPIILEAAPRKQQA